MDHFAQILYDHRFSVGTVAWYIFSGLIVTMPGKDEPFQIWPWFYDFTHLLLNLKPVPAFKQAETAKAAEQTENPTK